MEITLMTFNLRYHTPADGENAWPHRAAGAAHAIAHSGAAVVGTQEGLLDMLKDLESALPGYAWLGEGRQGEAAGEHNAIFYKTNAVQVVEQGQFWLSESPETPGSQSWGSNCPRICTWARFRTRSHEGKEFLLFNTHLDHRSQEAREKGIAMILRALDTTRQALNCPAFLMGDFNSTPDNSVVKLLRGREDLADAYAILGKSDAEIGATLHGFTGAEHGLMIDYIFGTRDATFTAVRIEREKVNGKYLSDHYPVIATARL